tara:strand:+ start:353 stop:1783 length:1431 start_codon:yes stop_codon:yes gene_type:complete
MLHIIKLIKNSSLKELYFFLFLIAYWFLIWSSIGVEYNSILHFGYNTTGHINFFRINTPLLLSIISCIFIFFKIFKIKKIENYFNIIFLFYLYFFFQLIGLFLNKDIEITLGNTFLLILGIGTINIFLYLKIYNYENFSKVLLYVSLVFCAIFVFFIFISNINKMSEHLAYSTFYSISLPGDRLLDHAYPRTTGLSRLFAVVNIFLIAFYLKINPNKKKLAFFILIITTLFGTIIWGFQSRGTIICYFSALLIIIFLFKNENKPKFLNFVLIIILPILIFNGSSTIVKKLYFKYKYDIDINTDLPENKRIELEKKIQQIENKPIYSNRFMKKNNISSGRVEIWQYVISNYDKKKIFGYGVQGDRFLLGKKYKTYGNNSSNVFVYFFVSGGYLSIFILILIILRILIILLKIYFQSRHEEIKESFIFKLCLMLTIFFLVRGLVENSYGLFSIDFLLFITSIFIIENLFNKSIRNTIY